MAQQDVFSREGDIGQPYAADQARMMFTQKGSEFFTESMLVQNVTIGYTQNVTRLWEVNGNKQYFVAGRTQGNITIARVVGPKGLNLDFLEQFGNVCNVADSMLGFSFKTGCNGALSESGIICSGCVITGVNYTVAAQDMVINEQTTMMYAFLRKLNANAGNGGGAGGESIESRIEALSP